MTHRVATFTLHHLPRSARVLIDEALAHYESAFATILHALSKLSLTDLQTMATYGYTQEGAPRRSVEQIVKQISARKVPAIVHALSPLESSLRESLLRRVGESVLSYLALAGGEHQQPAFPCPDTQEERDELYAEALANLAGLADNLEEETLLRDALAKGKLKRTAVLDFCRIEAGRNCGLFYSPVTKTFYARLFLVPNGHRHGSAIDLHGPFIDIRKQVTYRRYGEAYPGEQSFGRGTRSIMVPLEMGRYHEEPLRYLNTAFLPQRGSRTDVVAAEPKTAKLVRKLQKDGTLTYELHVAFEVPTPKIQPTKTVLGIDRGIYKIAAGAVLSESGTVLHTVNFDGLRLKLMQKQTEQALKRRQQRGKTIAGKSRHTTNEHYINTVANEIVTLALDHEAQIVMENLAGFAKGAPRPKGQRKSNFRAQMSRRQYQALLHAVNERLELVGLPRVWTVSPAYTSITCSMCGTVDKKSRSREDRSLFCCTHCHYHADADVNASVNIARKYVERRKASLTNAVEDGILSMVV